MPAALASLLLLAPSGKAASAHELAGAARDAAAARADAAAARPQLGPGFGPARTQPHLVYVLIDDLGFNDDWDRSPDLAWPNVAQLAREGLSLEHFYTQPLCTPTRGALMSGRWPVRLGLQDGVIEGGENYGLPLEEVTLAEKLKEVGYHCYGVGKWVRALLLRLLWLRLRL